MSVYDLYECIDYSADLALRQAHKYVIYSGENFAYNQVNNLLKIKSQAFV